MDRVHAAPAVAKRMWSYLRAVFFMARKGLLSNKRRLLVGLHLLMKRRNKAVARTVAGLLSLSHSHSHRHYHGGYHGNSSALRRRREYEFSCSDSPDPRSSSYFPDSCLVAEELTSPAAAAVATRIDYSAAASPAPSSPGLLLIPELVAPGEEDFSVRVSNYSSEEEAGAGSEAVDDDAEEFIRRFYEQLRRQNQTAMLPYCYLQESSVAC